MNGWTIPELARALDGVVSRGAVLAPGPGHSKTDRSLSVKVSHQSPDGFLAHSFSGDDWRACRDHVAARLGIRRDRHEPRPEPVRGRDAAVQPAADVEARMARAASLWAEAADPRGTVVEHYLATRGLALPDDVAGEALRFHPSCLWMESDQLVRVPAMLAAMRAVDGDRITAVHRTRLTPDGAKVGRRMLGIAAGAAIKLDANDAVTMGLTVGEGIETCLAARQIGFLPVWALASAGAVAAFPVVGGIEALSILAEADPAGQRASGACADRWLDAGREVLLIEPTHGSDMNDAIRREAA